MVEHGGSITLLSTWQPVAGPSPGPISLKHTTFSPWGAWPGGAFLDPNHVIDADVDGSYAVGPTYSSMNPIVLLSLDPPVGGFKTGSFTKGIVPATPSLPTFSVLQTGVDRAVIAKDSLGSISLFAMERTQNLPDGTQSHTLYGDIHWVGHTYTPKPVACAGAPLYGDAAAISDRLYFALSNSTSYHDPACASGSMAPPSRLQLVYIGEPNVENVMVDIPTPGISDVRIARATNSSSTYVVWAAGDEQFFATSIWAMKETPNNFSQPIELSKLFPSPSLITRGSLTAVDAGGYLYLAWIEPSVLGTIHVAVIDPDGVYRASIDVPAEDVGSTLSMVAGPNRNVVVAWDEMSFATPSPGRVLATRIDCVDATP